MIISEEQRIQFTEISKPLIKWLNDNCDPHATVVVDNTKSELMYGVCAHRTEEYWKD